MPLTRSDIPNLLLSGIRDLFFETYNGVRAQANWAPLVMTVDSNKDMESYAWLGQIPSMQEWISERVIKSMNESKYTLTNKLWESTLGVDRTAIEDDMYGQIRIKVRSLAEEAARHTEQLIFDTIKSGGGATYGLCYDGQYFFDSDHANTGAEYTTSQSNTGSTALSSAAVQAAIKAMRKVKDDRGVPMGINPTHLVVPPDLEFTALEILNSVLNPDATAATYAANTKANVLAGRLQLIVSPYLTDTTDWFLFDCSRSIKPIILQTRTAAEIEALESGSTGGFMRDQYLYGVRERKAVGYGLWQLAYGSIVTGS